MFTPPAEVSAVLAAFAPLFTEPSWLRAQALLCGVLLAPANRTLTAVLHALRWAGEPGFQNYHRLLTRARWSARQAAQVLLELLVEAFVPSGPVIIGLDDTIERRRGRKLTARAGDMQVRSFSPHTQAAYVQQGEREIPGGQAAFLACS